MDNEVILQVPFKEKDEVKMLGAKWNPQIKKWYVPAEQSLKPFSRWLPQSKSQKEDEYSEDS